MLFRAHILLAATAPAAAWVYPSTSSSQRHATVINAERKDKFQLQASTVYNNTGPMDPFMNSNQDFVASSSVKNIANPQDDVYFFAIDSVNLPKLNDDKEYYIELSHDNFKFRSVSFKPSSSRPDSYLAAVNYFVEASQFKQNYKSGDMNCDLKVKAQGWGISHDSVVASTSISYEDIIQTFDPDIGEDEKARGGIENNIECALTPNTKNEVIKEGTTMKLKALRQRWTNQFAYHHAPECLPKKDRDMQFYFKALLNGFPSFVTKLKVIEASQLPVPKDEADPNLKMITQFENNAEAKFQFPAEDEHVEQDIFIKLLPFFTSSTSFDEEKNTPFMGSRADTMYEVRQAIGNLLQQQQDFSTDLVIWEDYVSDAVMKRIFFSSIGQHVVKKDTEGDGYVADFMELDNFKYRPGYESYACKVRLDKNGDIRDIEDIDGTMYKPATKNDSVRDQRMWEWIKQKARSAIFTEVSNLHLVTEHYTWGNHGGTSMRMFLPKNHPFRTAFAGHFWRTAFTCAVASPILYDKNGLLARLKSFEYKGGLEDLFIKNLKEFKFKTYEEELQERGLDKCEFHAGATDGMDLHRVMVKYASGMIDELYPSEDNLQADDAMRKTYGYMAENLRGTPTEYNLKNMKKVWGETLFRVSGLHSSIGNVQAWALDPSMINMRLKKPPADGEDDSEFRWDLVAPKESIYGIALISGFAMAESPTLSQDWKHVFENDPNIFKNGVPQAYKTLRQDLDQLEQTIKARNKERKYPCADFRPSHCELSITS